MLMQMTYSSLLLDLELKPHSHHVGVMETLREIPQQMSLMMVGKVTLHPRQDWSVACDTTTVLVIWVIVAFALEEEVAVVEEVVVVAEEDVGVVVMRSSGHQHSSLLSEPYPAKYVCVT